MANIHIHSDSSGKTSINIHHSTGRNRGLSGPTKPWQYALMGLVLILIGIFILLVFMCVASKATITNTTIYDDTEFIDLTYTFMGHAYNGKIVKYATIDNGTFIFPYTIGDSIDVYHTLFFPGDIQKDYIGFNIGAVAGFLAFAIGGLICFGIGFIKPKKKKSRRRKKSSSTAAPQKQAKPKTSTALKCPCCGGRVSKTAKICSGCGSRL